MVRFTIADKAAASTFENVATTPLCSRLRGVRRGGDAARPVGGSGGYLQKDMSDRNRELGRELLRRVHGDGNNSLGSHWGDDLPRIATSSPSTARPAW